MVNMRREFFYATPEDVRDALVELGTGHVLEFTSEPEALEFRASSSTRDGSVASVAASLGDEDGDLSDDGIDS